MKKKISQLKIFAQISKNVENKKWKCIIDDCNSVAINSHLLQQNGILNIVADSGHITEMRQTDFLKWNQRNPPIQMARVGIRNAFSLQVFCSEHDSSIFKRIETPPVNNE